MTQHFGIVREKDTGKPRVDDPSTLHPIQLGMLTLEERAELGVHSGPFAVTAGGIFPLTKSGDDYRAGEDLRAVGQIIEPGAEPNSTTIYKVFPRTDVRAGKMIGGQITVEQSEGA